MEDNVADHVADSMNEVVGEKLVPSIVAVFVPEREIVLDVDDVCEFVVVVDVEGVTVKVGEDECETERDSVGDLELVREVVSSSESEALRCEVVVCVAEPVEMLNDCSLRLVLEDPVRDGEVLRLVEKVEKVVSEVVSEVLLLLSARLVSVLDIVVDEFEVFVGVCVSSIEVDVELSMEVVVEIDFFLRVALVVLVEERELDTVMETEELVLNLRDALPDVDGDELLLLLEQLFSELPLMDLLKLTSGDTVSDKVSDVRVARLRVRVRLDDEEFDSDSNFVHREPERVSAEVGLGLSVRESDAEVEESVEGLELVVCEYVLFNELMERLLDGVPVTPFVAVALLLLGVLRILFSDLVEDPDWLCVCLRVPVSEVDTVVVEDSVGLLSAVSDEL